MLDRAVLAQLEVPPVVLDVHAQLANALSEHVQALLALAAAAQLAHAGHQQVSRRDGLAVLVGAHVEGLDLLGIVGHKHRPAEVLLGQVALVLGLHVTAPVGLVLELVAALFQDVDRLGVGAAHEVRVAHGAQALDQALVHEAVQELHLVRALGEYRVDDVLNHVLLKVHVLLQGGESHFGLDHPELGRVALGVGALGAEGRAEGVHVAEGERQRLGVELTGHGQGHGLAEEVLTVVDRAVLPAGRVGKVERRNLEHLARALAVAAGDQRGVDVDEAAVVEEAVNGLSRHRADAEGALEQVGARAQVRDGAQVLGRMALLLERVVDRAFAQHAQRLGLQLERLRHIGRDDQAALGLDGAAHGDLFGDFAVIIQAGFLHDDLQVSEAGAVVELDERKVLGFAHGTHPALHANAGNILRRLAGKQLSDSIISHGKSPPSMN